MLEEKRTAEVNLYESEKGGAISVSAVATEGAGYLFKEGAYAGEKVLSELLQFLTSYKISQIHLRSMIPGEPGRIFRRVDNSFLSEMGNSLKQHKLEVQVVLS